jgi:hypothetical protein
MFYLFPTICNHIPVSSSDISTLLLWIWTCECVWWYCSLELEWLLEKDERNWRSGVTVGTEHIDDGYNHRRNISNSKPNAWLLIGFKCLPHFFGFIYMKITIIIVVYFSHPFVHYVAGFAHVWHLTIMMSSWFNVSNALTSEYIIQIEDNLMCQSYGGLKTSLVATTIFFLWCICRFVMFVYIWISDFYLLEIDKMFKIVGSESNMPCQRKQPKLNTIV